MLVTMKEILDRANAENYAVVAPNIFSEMDARACLEAAEQECSPIILDVAPQCTPDMVFLGSYLTRLCEKAGIPVAINLDHGKTYEDAVRAIRAGFTSIMVDRSILPYEENVAKVSELVRMAHAVGVSVESELGHVGSGCDYTDGDSVKNMMTQPEQAKDFIERTGVDCLAVAIGTAHGAYAGTPHLDFDRLQEIKAIVKIPLVLHGGSGTGDENIARACRLGINKVNVCTELLSCMHQRILSTDLHGDKVFDIWATASDGIRDRVRELIHICGCNGKAWQKAQTGLGFVQTTMRE